MINGVTSSQYLFSGKTHTMYGARGGEEGVIDMAVSQLFYAMEETPNRQFLVKVSSLLLCLTQTCILVNSVGLIHRNLQRVRGGSPGRPQDQASGRPQD